MTTLSTGVQVLNDPAHRQALALHRLRRSRTGGLPADHARRRDRERIAASRPPLPILFLGAGEAGIGIADLIVDAMASEGLSPGEARRRCWFVDSKGLVVASRTDLHEHKQRYAHGHAPIADLVSAVDAIKPTALIGVSGQPNTFTRAAIEKMSAINVRPVIFALSNPTTNSECTAEEACMWSGGRALFASGSPFPPVNYTGLTFVPRQANNVYVFPGIGLGVVACGARHVTDGMFQTAARTLAAAVGDDDRQRGALFPPLTRIREVSASIATEVARVAYDEGLATMPHPGELSSFVRSQMYDPHY